MVLSSGELPTAPASPAGKPRHHSPGGGVEVDSAPQISFRAVETDRIPGTKIGFDVFLEEPTTTADLRALALHLHRLKGCEHFERAFFAYYLPGMESGAGAWATTHFNPSLDVQVLGPSYEEIDRIRTAESEQGVETLGRWLDTAPFVGGGLTLVHDSSGYSMRRSYADGSKFEERLGDPEETAQDSVRYAIEENGHGEYYVMDGRGNLQICDAEGVIKTLSPLE